MELVSSEGKRWTLVRREAEPGHEPGRWRVDYGSERLWGFEYEVVVPASKVERLQHLLKTLNNGNKRLEAEVERLKEALRGLLEVLPAGTNDWKRIDAIREARLALHPDEPKKTIPAEDVVIPPSSGERSTHWMLSDETKEE